MRFHSKSSIADTGDGNVLRALQARDFTEHAKIAL
jgi:hypothetical protein